MPKGEGKVVAQNKKAYHDYFIEETYEAGIVLQGTEIKSIREGRVNLKDAMPRIQNGEAVCLGCISAHMSREIVLTTIHYGHGSYCFIRRKSIN